MNYSYGRSAKNNAELVERAAALIRAMGLEVASPEEARQIVGLKPGR